MSLAAGTRLGAYEILSALGAGGMGEVYRARDTKLGRDVALKIIPDAFALDPDRVARFKREAQVLASLNDPHIAAIYGFEDSGAIHALVLELVEGDTLADRIARGPIPLDEALPIARQIAEALEAAHEHGIIHRDLKPANIKITPDGVVKVLDFGLAKLHDANASSNSSALSLSPTITSPAMMTGVGMILGTAAYMAPEQAKGRPADKRSDVWAFGCVLYEMLAGRRAFEGDDVSDTMAAILRGEPDWSALPATTPPRMRALLRNCLRKDRKQRIPDIAVARFELDAPPDVADASATNARMRVRERVAWIAVGLLLLGVTAALIGLARARVPDPSRVVFSLEPPEGMRYPVENAGAMFPEISPDGRQLAFVVRNATGVTQLAVRMLSSPEVRVLQGTDSPNAPFWSPDGREIAFFAGGQLKKVDVAGGGAQIVTAAPAAQTGAWNRDGVILFTGATGPIVKVASTGGETVPVTTLDASQNDVAHRGPSFLPDGRRFLYLAQPANRIFIASLDSAERTPVLAADSKAVYAATGHLLFIRNSTLMAASFDARQGKATGNAFRVADDVATGPTGRAPVSVAGDGTLVYMAGGGAAVTQPAWFDRSGRRLGTVGEEGRYAQLALSPDGTKVAFQRIDQAQEADIWLLDVARNISARLTFDRGVDPIWSPDGTAIAYVHAGNPNRIYQKSVGGGDEAVLWEGKELRYIDSWSSDGALIAYHSANEDRIGVIPLTKTAPALDWPNTPFAKDEPHISPDGRWMAYQSNESGQPDVYVEAFPRSGQKVRISMSGGGAPRWRADGRELFYLTPTGMLMAVRIEAAPRLEAGGPQQLFKTPIDNVALGLDRYDVTADGQRFLILDPTNIARHPPITVVLNWTAGRERP